MSSNSPKDQQHPQYRDDRQIVTTLLSSEPSEYHLAELARLRIRYGGFPGARDIQDDLDKVLQQWGLSEDELFEKTREIHQVAQVYKHIGGRREDWS